MFCKFSCNKNLMHNSRSPSTSVLNQAPMNDVELRFAQHVTDKMAKYPISFFLLNPIDPERDNLPNYLSIIKPNEPMDLSTVSNKLKDRKYKTIDDWKKDMNMIWSNALKYNHIGDPYNMIATELMKIFRQKTEFIPRTEADEWMRKIRKLNKKIKNVSEGKVLINYAPPVKPTPGKKKAPKENIFD